MKVARSAPIACTLLPLTDRQEKDRLWGQVREAFLGSESLRDGFRLRFKASRAALQSLGTLIALERECCRFLHIRLDVPPSSAVTPETMSLSLTGETGTREFLASALAQIGIPVPAAHTSSRWVALGGSALSFAILCCAIPPLLLALGMTGLAGWFSVLDSHADIIIAGSAGALMYGLYSRRNRRDGCAPGC